MSNSKPNHFQFKVSSTTAGLRLDVFVVSILKDMSRAHAQRLIRDGFVLVGGQSAKSSLTVKDGSLVSITIPAPKSLIIIPEQIPLSILYEDSDLIVINKSADMVVHPAAGHSSGTLVNAILAHCKDLSGIGGEMKPGIVHRLDRGTSGVMVVAKNDKAHNELARQFKDRTVKKIYTALTYGVIKSDSGVIETPIGRSIKDRKKFSTRTRKGRIAVTQWNVIKRFGNDLTLLEIKLHTGRTHQIRVHFSETGHPLVGDSVYGGTRQIKRISKDRQYAVASFLRPALHSKRLGFHHPQTGKWMEFEAPLPLDLGDLLNKL